MSLAPLRCIATNLWHRFAWAVGFPPFHLFSECLLAKRLMTLMLVAAQRSCGPFVPRKPGGIGDVGLAIYRRGAESCNRVAVMAAPLQPAAFTRGMRQRLPCRGLTGRARPTLKMPEPLTTVGPRLQPIKSLAVKCTLLTFIPKHSTKFNDCAYEQNRNVSPCQQSAWCSLSSAFLSGCCLPVSMVIVIVLNQTLEKRKKRKVYIFTVLKIYKYSQAAVPKTENTDIKVKLAKGSWINSELNDKDIQNNQ